MVYRLEISPKAKTSFEDAVAWYESKSEGLGLRFMQSVLSALDVISEKRPLHAVRKHGFRHYQVPGFPYQIIYKIQHRTKAILVTRICHAHSNPRKKYGGSK
jgi:plasmid stabilization system protein ParE